MSDLTGATGLTKGAIYGNFENKEAVALAVFDYNTKRKNAVISSQLEIASTSREKLLLYVELFSSTYHNIFLEGGCPLLNTGVEADDTHEALRKKVSDEIIAWKNDLIGILKKGIDDKEFKDNFDVERLALSLIALIEGAIFVGRATKNKQAANAILFTAKELINKITL